MEKFGRMAIYLVALLLAAGIYLLTQLLSSIDQLFSTLYGQAMLIKLLAVAALLTLGALNKFSLVPRLDSDTGRQSLARSIRFEMVLALGILGMTAHLTTNVGL
jgi:putative copper resistance protein D